MSHLILVFVVLCGYFYHISLSMTVSSRTCNRSRGNITDIYSFKVKDGEGKLINLETFRGQVLLIVNVASYCSLSNQYHQLNALKDKYGNLEIVAFPCGQFQNLEPGETTEEIMNAIKYVKPGNGFTPSFPIFSKVDVNGQYEDPLFTFLKELCPATRNVFSKTNYLMYSPLKNNDIRWNFVKFLVNKNGRPVTRYDPKTEPNELKADLERSLRENIS